MASDIAANLHDIRLTIAAAAQDAGRKTDDVTLVAVSKVQPDDRIDAALAAGQRVFGENRVQEAQSRWEPRRPLYPDLRLHLIGPLQTNKARAAVALFDVIETLDRPALVAALAAETARQNRHPDILIQVNTGAEPQKSGVLPAELPSLYAAACSAKLRVVGLMCIPPADEPPTLHFGLLKTLADTLTLKTLSMGMSADYETAIRLGATHVRVGSAVFGERKAAA